jgi:hypothetical protein
MTSKGTAGLPGRGNLVMESLTSGRAATQRGYSTIVPADYIIFNYRKVVTLPLGSSWSAVGSRRALLCL